MSSKALLLIGQLHKNFGNGIRKRFFANVMPCSSGRFFSDIAGDSKARASHPPNALEKYLLVWMKKYPSVKDVPNHVTYEMMEKVRNWTRIRLTIVICLLTAVGCVAMVKSGKSAAKRGESVHKMNIDWHKSINENEK